MNNWSENNNRLEKEFTFDDFKEVMDFVNQVSKLAEEMNHHPDIHIYDYKKASFSITTHSENQITDKDRELADKISKAYQNFNATKKPL